MTRPGKYWPGFGHPNDKQTIPNSGQAPGLPKGQPVDPMRGSKPTASRLLALSLCRRLSRLTGHWIPICQGYFVERCWARITNWKRLFSLRYRAARASISGLAAAMKSPWRVRASSRRSGRSWQSAMTASSQ